MATITKRTGKGGTTYKVQIRMKGQPAETASFDRLTDARKWASDIESAIRGGRHFGTARRRSFDDLAKKYEASIADTLKSAEARQGHIAYWRTVFTGMVLAEITPAVVATERDKLAKLAPKRGRGTQAGATLTPATVNRYLATLSACFTFARKELHWIERNPCAAITKPAENNERVRYLSDDERTKLLAACKESRNEWLYLAVVLALSTGARQGELMSLRWPQVDFGRRTILLRAGETKNKAGRVLPLTGEALDMLRARSKVRSLTDDRVFAVPAESARGFGSMKNAWDNALARAGVEDFRFHDLRHTAASYLTMAGVGSMEVAKVLGHKTLQMTARYSHLSPERTVEIGDVLTKRLGLGGKGEVGK